MCDFTKKVKCTGEGCSQEVGVDFTDTMVMGDMVRGLADLEVKTIVL